MAKYVVVRIKGHQYRVSEGESILVDKLGKEDPKVEVLMIVNDNKVEVGKPIVKDANLKLKVLDAEVKGEKIKVFKYKPKSRYRKTRGFRSRLSRVVIEKIS